jgi:N-acylglucosamine-6-phosphate 2-epimerase
MDRHTNLGSAASLMARLAGGLVVSCQAPDGHPLRDTSVIARLASAATLGGAVGLRVNSPDDVRAVKAATELPVIGIHKVRGERRDLITPGFEYAEGLVAAGADIVALEVTAESPGDPPSLVAKVRAELGVPVLADVATEEEGRIAVRAGADLVATTLSGYTAGSTSTGSGPDIDLVGRLSSLCRVVGEGRYRTPQEVRAAFRLGAFAVVVGTAITDPVAITRSFVELIPAGAHDGANP